MSAEVSLANTNTANTGATRANTTIYGYAPLGLWGTDPLFIKPAGESSQVVYPITDHLGTPQMLVNQAGATVWEGRYSAFGIQLNQTSESGSSGQALRFPGQYADSKTQLYYNWNRYYDPESGRYITSDPIGLADGVNSFIFVDNLPVYEIDPTGLYGYNPSIPDRQRNRTKKRSRHQQDTSVCSYYKNVNATEGCRYHDSAYKVCTGSMSPFAKIANGILSACVNSHIKLTP